MSDDDKFSQASCPRCGSGDIVRSETPARTQRTGDGGLVRTWSKIVLCRGCGEVVWEKQLAERVDDPAAAKREEQEEKPAEVDRFKKIEID
jgi:hypothetical protein